MWIIARISSRKARIKNPLGEQLGAKWDELTRDGVAFGKDAGMRVELLANRALFQRLRDEIVF
ncbi:hypothetical protein [Aphanothece sacrum]|nr:hypothetical protein [Aphanothece sacrum]